MIFLIDYDRRLGKLVAFAAFEESQRQQAEQARLQLELGQERDGVRREVVLLEASTEDAIRRTHRRYFERIEDLVSIPESNGSSKSG